MRTGLKRGLVLGLTACMAVTSLAGCSKSKSGADASATIATLDGEKIDAGVANFFLRYQQAEFESSYGTFLKSYYGTDIWNADLTSSGIPYGETFKQEIMTSLEKMLLAEKHMGDYGVELTDEDKAAITQAAKDFIAANGEEVLEKMNATQENVERVLTLYTIQKKMEPQMSADVDTEVSDEEAAQRTVSYVRFTAQTEAETEAESETETDTEEVSTEAGSEASETESELPAETQAETETETEKGTEAALTETSAAKTGAADKAETESETETAAETESEAVTEASTESGSEVSTEAESETETETETETEDPAMAAAKEKARAEAEAFLADVKGQDDFAAAAAEIAETSDSIATSSYTFGDDDTYPDSAIISATKGLEDDTLVDEVIEVSNSYYVLHVDDAFNEEATDNKKTEIVNQRKTDALNALYDEWISAAEFTIDEEELGKLAFDLSLMLETEAQTEAATEAATETESETGAGTETEAVTEKETETESEAVTEAAETETETATETVAETETEKAAKKAEKIAETETETEVKKAETKTAGKTSAK